MPETAFLFPTFVPQSSPRPRTCRTRMCDEPLPPAERTRRVLAETKPLVKFRRETEYLDEDASFTYTRGVDKGIDIWLVTGILTFLVPLVGFAIGVATGYIEISPR